MDTPAQLQSLVNFHQSVLDHLPLNLVVYEVVNHDQFRVFIANRSMLALTGFSLSEIVGKFPSDFLAPGDAMQTIAQLRSCIAANATTIFEDKVTLAAGEIWLSAISVPMRDADGTITHIMGTAQDITARKQQEQKEHEQQEQIILQQALQLAELSTPLFAISERTVLMPLVGALDSRRVQQIMEALLVGVAQQRATWAILDITGVPIVDTQVANALIQAAQAVKLLGAQVVLTGIRPEVAQTLVGLGVDLSGIVTRGTLRDGIAHAL